MSPHKKKTNKAAKALPAVPKTPVSEITPEQAIIGAVFLGKVQDYLSHLSVATLVLEAPLSVGDAVRIKGHTTDLTQKIDHIEVDRKSVPSASPGEGIGIKLADKVRIGDAVYKL
jgi:hypothetical protein